MEAKQDNVVSIHYVLRESEAFAALFETNDPNEGVSAFFDKRDPVWTRPS